MNHRYLIVAAVLLGVAVPASAQTVKSGIEAWQRSDYDAAVKIWRPLAEQGDPDAQFNLAQAYRLGRGVPSNLPAAQIWLERAAVQGHLDAQTTLGLLLFQSGDRPGAVRWLKAAAEKNEPRAMLVYGTALFNGDTVTQDAALGYAYVSRAAALGLAPAKVTIAQMDQVMSVADRKKAAVLIAEQKDARATDATGPTSTKTDTAMAETPKSTSKLASKEPTVEDSRPSKTVAERPTRVRVPAAKATPAKSAAAKELAPAKTGTPSKKPAASAPAAAKPSGSWRIQLGAFSRRSSAEALFRKLSAAAPVSGRSAFYNTGGAVTRLQAGPFLSKAAADDACRALSARRQPCFPVPAR